MAMTLHRACILKIASLIKQGFWSEVNSSQEENPFYYLPSNVVDELTTAVLKLSAPGTLKVTDLYYLLTSRRIKHFELNDILLSTDEFVAIVMSLSVGSQNLRSLTLKNVNCKEKYKQKSTYFRKSEALECLLKVSPKLEHLDTCIEFDLKVIRNSYKLRTLKLNFVRRERLYHFLEEDNGRFFTNASLEVLEFFEDHRTPIPYLELVPILRCCTALTHVNADISRALEFMHGEELYDGSVTRQYKLKKCLLGSTYLDNGAATHVALHVATVTCPDMREVDILANDNETIYALSDFKNLSSLLIQWELTNGGNFQLGVQPALESIGANLKILHIINFYNIDFAVIGANCPELEVLKVEYQSECQSYERPSACFKKLKNLHIELMELDYGCSEESLEMFLSHSTNLKNITIDGARNLTDRVLGKILSKNSLSDVKDALIFNCTLSEAGVRNLVSQLTSLEFLHFSSSLLTFDEAADVIHEINPMVILIADDSYD